MYLHKPLRFSPLYNYSVSVPSGCEAIIHSITSIVGDDTIRSQCKWTLEVDFNNFFNSIDCESLFREVRTQVPSIAAWMECCYCSRPFLCLGGHTLRSCCGVQQVDPLGSLGLHYLFT